MREFPSDFRERMKRLLGNESPSFWDAMRNQPPERGLRVNTLKIKVEDYKSLAGGNLFPLPWTDLGFKVVDENLGSHPYHAAGLYYLQEPSAMAVSEILNPQPGEIILDIAAAPGGKTTHLATLMKNQGALIANDPHGGRIQALARNLERWGAHNIILTQESPKRLAEHFGSIFDRVLVDAPCSGEGTFRKDPGEMKNWSVKYIQRCASLQNEILWYAAQLVRPGGHLVYSTCTFSPEENEGSVKRLLNARPDFKVHPITGVPGFSPGNPDWVEGPPSLQNTVRIWPHKAPGEGHFIAHLTKTTEKDANGNKPSHFPELSPQYRTIYQKFVDLTLEVEHLPHPAAPENQNLVKHGDRLYAVTKGAPPLKGLRVQQWGWWLGTFNRDRFHPSHALAMGLPAACFKNRLDFNPQDPQVMRYIRGLTIKSNGKGHWVGITVNGYPLGWGERKKDKVHSLSPRWLSHI